MAVHNDVVREMGGFSRGIEQSGLEMAMDALQRGQYQFPVKSTTRELISNALDSIADKKVARAILTGKSKVEDFFVEREGEIYNDSHFDPTYFDLKWLSDDEMVHMRYICGTTTERDQVTFEDNGIGLGGKRLEGYFQLMYSTKRLCKLPLGKFGVGAKAGLSVGVDFYTVESRYNGRLYRFNVYLNTADSIIPKFNMKTGKENSYTILGEGTKDEYKAYYEDTEQLNGFKVTIAAKKGHRQQYIDAVKLQLLYFDNIDFKLIHEDRSEEIVHYKAHIIYEDEHIILSDNQLYAKPHILLNKVTYGYVDWSELELEDKVGNIGIKVAPEQVDINQSREAINWTDKTKQIVVDKFKEVVEIASRFINEELQDTDFWQWIKTCYSISGKYKSNTRSVVGRLAGIIDISEVKPTYPKDRRVQFNTQLIEFDNRIVQYSTRTENGVQIKQIHRRGIIALGQYMHLPVYLRKFDERASNRKDKFLLSMYPEGFVTLMEPFSHALWRDPSKKSIFTKEVTDEEEALEKKGRATNAELWRYLSESTHLSSYEEVLVPPDFKGTEEEEDKVTPETVEEAKITMLRKQTDEDRRKTEGKIVVNTLKGQSSLGNDSPLYNWVRFEHPIKTIGDWKAEEIYYVQTSEEEDKMAKFVAMLTRDTHPSNNYGPNLMRRYAESWEEWTKSKWYRLNRKCLDKNSPDATGVLVNIAYHLQHFFDAKVMIVRVSQANQKYVRDFQPIRNFFIQIKNKTITMSNTLIQWNTARIIQEKLGAVAFLYNFQRFDYGYAGKYITLTKYVDLHYRRLAPNASGRSDLSPTSYDDLLKHLDNVRLFQDTVRTSRDQTMIAELAGKLFGNKELKDGMAVDPEMMDLMDEVLEYAVGCGTMLNYIPMLTGYMTVIGTTEYMPGQVRYNYDFPEQLETEIKLYLEHKGMLRHGGLQITDQLQAAPEETDPEDEALFGEVEDNAILQDDGPF